MGTFRSIAVACAFASALAVPAAQAQPSHAAHGLRAGGEHLLLGAQRNVFTDGAGNAAGAASGGFATDAGGHGLRTRRFSRSSDGSLQANGHASATGANGGTAERSGSFTRSADGTASGERSTTATNARTGTTFDATATYTKGAGVSRSASCTDAAGNAVACGSSR